MQRLGSIALVALLLTPIVAFAQPRVSVWVTPQVRDGFVDVDAGTLDSIADIKRELSRSGRFTVAVNEGTASVTLIVLGRRTAGTNGGVGIPLYGGSTIYAPINRRAIDMLLKVGDYQRAITSEDDSSDTWTGAAKRAVKDLTVWVEANRSQLKPH